jgi:hypothetical protein
MSAMRTSVLSVSFLSVLVMVPASGQDLAENFDLSGDPVVIQGVITGMTFRRENSYMVVDTQDESNGSATWVIVGNDMPTLIARRWDLPQIPAQQPRNGPAGFSTRRGIPYRGQNVTVATYMPVSSAGLEDILGNDPATLGGAPVGAPVAFAALAGGGPEVDLGEAFAEHRIVYSTTVSFEDGEELVFGNQQ